jgi:hypothetical protein
MTLTAVNITQRRTACIDFNPALRMPHREAHVTLGTKIAGLGGVKIFSLALALLLSLATVRPAAGDPINITSGHLDLSPFFGPLVLEGDRGFTFSSGVDGSGGFIAPWMQCNGDPANCTPGRALSLAATWIGNDVTGPATLDGITYLNVGSMNSPSSMSVHFTGIGVLPPLSGSVTEVIYPFLFGGTFFHPLDAGFVRDELAGSGLVTLTLTPGGAFPGTWYLSHARYEFLDPAVPSPAPEPATLVLMGTGLFGLAALFRRHINSL